MCLGRSSRGHLWVKKWCKIFSQVVPLPLGVHKQGVKQKSLIFFYLVSVAYLLVLGPSRVWKKTTRKCMLRDLRFSCDAMRRKSFFVKKSQVRFFCYATYCQKRIKIRDEAATSDFVPLCWGPPERVRSKT